MVYIDDQTYMVNIGVLFIPGALHIARLDGFANKHNACGMFMTAVYRTGKIYCNPSKSEASSVSVAIFFSICTN